MILVVSTQLVASSTEDSALKLMSKYPDLSSGDAEQILAEYRHKLLTESERILLNAQDENCKPKVQVQFEDGKSLSSSQKDFVKGIFRVEIVQCFQSTPEVIVDVFYGDEFNIKAFESRLDYFKDGELLCSINEAPMVGRTSLCVTADVSELQSGDFVVKTSLDRLLPDNEGKMYMLESINVVMKSNSATKMHLISYLRGRDVNSFIKSIATNWILSEQKKAMKVLHQLVDDKSE
jgi:hypothetical protein